MNKIKNSRVALWKLDHTICMNNNEDNLKWNIDDIKDYPEGGYDPDDTDCKSIEEASQCIDLIADDLEILYLVKRSPAELGFIYDCKNYSDYIKTFTSIGGSKKDAPYNKTEFKKLKNYFGDSNDKSN